MKARAFLMAAAVLLAPWSARAQTASDAPVEGEASGGSTGWRLYPRERHLLLRVTGSTGYRILDPFASGRLAPPTLAVDGAFTLAHIGRFQIGPYLGLQIGFDRLNQVQFAVVPGAVIQRRFNRLLAFNARVGVPIGIVRGNCAPFSLDATGRQGMGALAGRNFVQVPDTSFCPAVSPGIELAAGGALYLLSGFAVTAELSFNVYWGDGGTTYPIVGGGLGLLFDFEVLP